MATSEKTIELLKKYESRNITYFDPEGDWPIVWKKAKGTHVWDIEGKKYLDLTAAFGVASAGHANPQVVKAGKQQMETLLHAMGDVHPHLLKAKLCRKLSQITFERWTEQKLTGKTILCNSGFEAVEAGLKTAALATGKSGIIAFEKAYHGLGYGALSATHREHFRSPFRNQIRDFGSFLRFPKSESDLEEVEEGFRQVARWGNLGAVLLEPVQARGGINIPPPGFLPMLRRLCDEHGALLILDEIYTGFGRAGKWFACEHSQTIPDIVCLGKAMTGGFPMSACVGNAEVMDRAWPVSEGEAIHTSTFLGHPVGCAMALAQIKTITHEKLVERSAELGAELLENLSGIDLGDSNFVLHARGMGLMAGLELFTSEGKSASELSLKVIKEMLKRGFILLPEGEDASVISFTPPLTISSKQLVRMLTVLKEVLLEFSK